MSQLREGFDDKCICGSACHVSAKEVVKINGWSRVQTQMFKDQLKAALHYQLVKSVSVGEVVLRGGQAFEQVDTSGQSPWSGCFTYPIQSGNQVSTSCRVAFVNVPAQSRLAGFVRTSHRFCHAE